MVETIWPPTPKSRDVQQAPITNLVAELFSATKKSTILQLAEQIGTELKNYNHTYINDPIRIPEVIERIVSNIKNIRPDIPPQIIKCIHAKLTNPRSLTKEPASSSTANMLQEFTNNPFIEPKYRKIVFNPESIFSAYTYNRLKTNNYNPNKDPRNLPYRHTIGEIVQAILLLTEYLYEEINDKLLLSHLEDSLEKIACLYNAKNTTLKALNKAFSATLTQFFLCIQLLGDQYQEILNEMEIYQPNFKEIEKSTNKNYIQLFDTLVECGLICVEYNNAANIQGLSVNIIELYIEKIAASRLISSPSSTSDKPSGGIPSEESWNFIGSYSNTTPTS